MLSFSKDVDDCSLTRFPWFWPCGNIFKRLKGKGFAVCAVAKGSPYEGTQHFDPSSFILVICHGGGNVISRVVKLTDDGVALEQSIPECSEHYKNLRDLVQTFEKNSKLQPIRWPLSRVCK